MRRACTKLVAKVRSQIRKKSVKGRVACSTELAGCLFDPPKVLSPLLVCCRFIRYQSDLPLVSRGFSAASGMRTKCPPELQSGSRRVLEIHTPTRDTLTLTWGGLMSSQGGSLHHSQQCSAPSTRSCALYLGFITVRRACLKLVAKTRRQLRKGSAKGDVTCSTELTRHVRWSHSETDSPLLVCSRFIRYQSGLPLVPRGCSAAFSVWTKCPPDWASGSDRLLDIHTPTHGRLSLAWGRLDVKSRHPLHHSQQCSTTTTCFCTVTRGPITVRTVDPKPVAKSRGDASRSRTARKVMLHAARSWLIVLPWERRRCEQLTCWRLYQGWNGFCAAGFRSEHALDGKNEAQ